MQRYHDIAFSPDAQRHQRARGSYEHYQAEQHLHAPEGLSDNETSFLTERDSFYIGTVGSNGWPYIQHRGGPAGFIKILDATHIAWIDRPGNKQFVSAGNIDHDNRVSIFAMDYPNRRRLKMYGHAHFDTQPPDATLALLGADTRIEGIVTVEVVAFDWNCAKFITPRYTEEQVQAVVAPLEARVLELEAQLARQ